MRFREMRRAAFLQGDKLTQGKAPHNLKWLSETERILARARAKRGESARVPDRETPADKAGSNLEALLRLVEKGNPDAATQYANLICGHVKKLNSLALSKPKLFKAYSRKCLDWPILKSPAPLLSQDEKRILKQLEIGKDSGRVLDQDSKWKPDGLVASLVDIFLEAVNLHRRIDVENGEAASGSRAFEIILFRQRGPEFFYGKFSGPKFSSAAEKLKPFGADSLEDWDRVIIATLKDCFNDPLCAKFLSGFVTAPSKQSPGRAKEYLIRKVRKRLLGLAGSK